MMAWILLSLQLAASTSEPALYNRILAETSPRTRLQLLLDFEKQFPESKSIAEIYSMIMDSYQARNNFPKLLEYGEKAIKADPENMHALLVVARQYALEGRNFDRSVSYAQRALKVAQAKRDKPPSGYKKEEWTSYVRQSIASAQSTLNYIRSIPQTLNRRKPKGD